MRSLDSKLSHYKKSVYAVLHIFILNVIHKYVDFCPQVTSQFRKVFHLLVASRARKVLKIILNYFSYRDSSH